MDLDKYWPRSVTHLSLPYDDGVADHVVIAEVNDAPYKGFHGFRKISTALVPLNVVDEVLEARGSLGHEVQSWGPHPCVSEGDIYETRFWIEGRAGREEKFQTILNAWQYHDQGVILPDSVLLMTYGLVPRYLADGTVCWDDPQPPVYDVVRARSHVDYNNKGVRPLALVTMRRDYLEDYCSLKNAAAVAVYYEERFDSGDKSHADALDGKEGAEFKLPGRLLSIAHLNDKYHTDAPQLSHVWGARLILKPAKRPITDAKNPDLSWPDHAGSMSQERAARDWLYAYVSDAVLAEYEARPEFTIHPESGGVSYGGWWGTNRTSRVGREHIRVELKMLYEGCPPHVIAHWNQFAVSSAVAELDRKNHENRNIALRAKELMYAFLRATKALEKVADELGLAFSQVEICGLNSQDIDDAGWWTVSAAKEISAVVRFDASQELFFTRAVALFKLLDHLKPAPLRNLVLQIGVPKNKIADFKSLKLFGTLCQLFAVANEHGYEIPHDGAEVVKNWDGARLLPALRRVFALNVLRDMASHPPGDDKIKKIGSACAVFEIDSPTTVTGWGFAIDKLYDGLIEDLHAIAEILEGA